MGVNLVPVDGDPFQQQAKAKAPAPGVKLTPVDGDPFASKPSILDRVKNAVTDIGLLANGVTAPLVGDAAHAAGRSAVRAAAPALAAAPAFGAGFAAGGTATAPLEAVPVVGPALNAGGAFAGGLLGAMGMGYLVDKAQQKVISALPESAQRFIGQDQATQQADAQQHPIATFAGGELPSLLTMRPGLTRVPISPDASLLTRVLSHPATGAAVGATLMGGQEAAREEATGEGLDPAKLAIAAGTGAVLNRPTKLGQTMFELGGNTMIKGLQRGAGMAGRMFAGDPGAARQGFDVEATATPVPREALPAPSNDIPQAPPEPEPVKPAPEPAAPAGGVKLVPVSGNPFVTAGGAAPPGSAVAPPPVAGAAPAEGKDGEGNAVAAGDASAPQSAPIRAPEPLQDGEQYVRTPAGNKVRTQMQVVDASTLNKAEGALQNRDRSRDTTDLQVQDIIGKFDPELLGNDPSSDRGAPIVHGDNTVLSGNGRMLALNKIFDQYPDKADAYRRFIESQGFSTDGMERPVLVRRVTQDLTPEEARQFVIESNKDNKLELSPVERARSDADAVTPEMLGKYAGGDLNSGANSGFVQDFTKSLTAGELGNVIGPDRRLTTAGIDRIENAVVAKAYEHPKLLEKLMESPHNEIRAITSSLANVAPAWAKMRATAAAGEIGGHYDITHDLADAAMRVAEARRAGTKPADILTQIDAFDRPSPVAEKLIEAFYTPGMKRPASVKAVTQFLQNYIDEARSQTTGTDIFGETSDGKAPADILNELLRQRDGNDAPLLDRSEGHENDTGRAPIGHQERDQGTARQGEEGRPRQGQAPAAEEGGPGRGARAAGGSAEPAGGNGGSAAHDGGEALEAPQAPPVEGHAKTERGAYQPSFEEASFTNRQSAYSSAIQALGLTEEKFNLLAPKRKAKLLIDALDKLTGIKVSVAPNMPLQYAVDQMLDAHQTLQGMASVLGVAPRALSLGGSVKLKLVGKASFLGSYSHGTGEITLPKRSNSFSHEWGHALDYHLLDLTGADSRGLSGAIREEGKRLDSGELPDSVRSAFVNLLNAMFFDGAEIAAKIMKLQEQIAKTESVKQKTALQQQIENILGGRSRAKEKSRYWKGADAMNKAAGEGDYWTQPTEMFARAFEAWIGFKLDNAGLGSEFVGKGNGNYLSDSEKRFQLTFPKGEERARIFDAFQTLIDAINSEQITSATGGPDMGKATGFDDVATPEEKAAVAKGKRKARNIIEKLLAPDLDAVEAFFHNREIDKEEKSRRGLDPMTAAQRLNNVRSLFFSASADGVKMVADRWGSKAALAIHDHFAFDLGGTRHVGRVWERAVELRQNAALNPVFDELEKIGGSGFVFKKLTREQKDTLAALLTARDGEPPVDDMGLGPLANAMRKAFNNEWYHQRNAGLDVGYVNDAGYLNRQIDRELVAGDPHQFTEQATKVYEIAFDRDVGEDAESIAADPEKLDAFVDLAKRYKIDGYKELRAAMRAEDGEGGGIAELVGEMFDAVRSAYASQSAHEYLDAILHQETFADYTPTTKLPSSEKNRALPAEADELLRDFYNPDPVSSLVHYVHQSVRRVEWNRRFGRPAGAKKNSKTIGQQLDDQMAREGVPAHDREYVWKLVDRMSGRYRRTGFLANPGVVNALGFLRVKGALVMLGRAFTLSTFEPSSLGLVTDNPVHGAKALVKTWAGILIKGQRHDMMEWARAQGFIRHHLLEQFSAMDRFGTTADQPTRWDKLAAGMFRNSGLTYLTHVSDAAVADVGRRCVINDVSHRVVGGGTRGEEAEKLMRELGIRDPKTFAKHIVDLNGALPSDEWLAGPEGFDYNTALDRLHFMTIQKPGSAEVAPMSRNPLAAYASYSITGFMQSAYRHLLKRNLKRGLRHARDHQWVLLGAMTAGVTLSAAILYAEQFMSSVAREYVWNPERQREWEKEGTWWKNNLALAYSRTFTLGWLDNVINAANGLKFNRDLAYLPLGAYAGNDAQNVTNVAKLFAKNSRKTNAAEFHATEGLYNLFVAPAIGAVVSAVPGGPIASGLGGMTTATLTGPIASKKAAELVVGKKEGSLGPDGKKIHSGPTAYDRALDAAFGPVKRKNAAN